MPNFAPRIRVEVYAPLRSEPAYLDTLTWLVEEFTELRGGCTVNENLSGYYLSQTGRIIDDRISIVHSDFPMNWDEPSDQADVLEYCANLKAFLLENLWEEEILITAQNVSHIAGD